MSTHRVIGAIILCTTPILGTLLGYLNLWLLGFLIPMNSHLQIGAVEVLSYVPLLVWGFKWTFFKTRSSSTV
jgi:hypothetical protein